MFGIKHPILLAGKAQMKRVVRVTHGCELGMNVAAGPELAAAVTNAGGLGVIGGHGYTPKVLRQQVCADLPIQRHTRSQGPIAKIKAIKADLKNLNAPFGVDLLIPQVGGNARKTNVCRIFLRSARCYSRH
jgi:hypothetical protein